MEVKKKILIPVEKEITENYAGQKYYVIFGINTSYVSKTGLGLIQQYSEELSSDALGNCYSRFSEDNGRTWLEPVIIFEPKKIKEGILRKGEGCFFLDGEKNILLQFQNYEIYPDDHWSGGVEKYRKIHIKISADGGKNFKEEQLIQKGFDEINWAKDVVYGKNNIALSFCHPFKTNKGKIILPAMRYPQGIDYEKAFFAPWEACCFIGEWKNNDIEWELSSMIKIDPKLSTRGLCEPTIAELETGKMLMLIRGSNDSVPDVPGYRWNSVSKDNGYTWSDPLPFTYDTGEKFFSPSTGSCLIRHTQTKKLYWIGNISEKNTEGNSPRYPLLIAEVDEKNICLLKKTIKVVEDRRPEDSPFVQFSNFRVYEDRETKEFVLAMPRIQEISQTNVSSPAYEYRFKPE